MGRSHRPLSSSDHHHHDDWVDGSWTVDCICGVTFDDGEEMVNCDDCGVWVHTRCSRYIKGDDLFTCDKCKGKSYSNGNNLRHSNNDSEETEVAQLLVELPTKTVRMESSYNGPPPPPLRRPFRLWAELPMEERVHVQGVPGGDRSVFTGASSVFTPDLWKCTGYVPKKFNFQYREFPCWDEKDNDEDEDEDENPVDKGAGVLFSLSKESVMAAPVIDLYGSNTDGGVLLPVSVHSSKRKREELGTSKNRSGKNKLRISEKELDGKKRAGHASKTVFVPTSDAKHLDDYEHRKPFKTDVHSLKARNSSDHVLRNPLPDVSVTVENSVAKKTKTSSETLTCEPLRHKVLDTSKQSEAKGGALIKYSLKADNVDAESLAEHNNAECNPVKKEVDSITDEKSVDVKGSVQNEDLAKNTAPDCKDNQARQNLNVDIYENSEERNTEVKNEVNDDNSRDVSRKDMNNSGTTYQHMSELSVTNGSHPSEPKAGGADEICDEAVNCLPSDKADELSSDKHWGRNRELPKGSTESKLGSDSPLKSDEVLSSSGQRKMIVCVVKSPTCFDITKTADSQNSGSKNSVPGGKKSRDEESMSRKGVKEDIKSYSKASHQSRALIDSSSKSEKSSASTPLHKSDKSSSHSSSKGNHAPSMHPSVPSNPSAALSDEELALLLHQELNSSPRVPRVPRVRHSGSLPQLASPTATTMLTKRTSSSGTKDHGLVPRRKGRAHEHDDAKRSDRLLPSSPDRRKRDGKPKNMSPAHGPSSSAEAIDYNLSSIPKGNLSDDDTGTGRGPVHRTLPGVINEIMSKGRRMTVDELCDAVLPHWNSLRKHNGERYAYSTHSQAVLDCLRNRHEWARLVDRGPKTSSSRKRRKFDEESEDNEYAKGGRSVESKSMDSEFPKGKRKARKRRRLELQGRGIKDTRSSRKDEMVPEDDENNRSFSCSSEDDSISTEDEIQQGSDSSDVAEST